MEEHITAERLKSSLSIVILKHAAGEPCTDNEYAKKLMSNAFIDEMTLKKMKNFIEFL